MIVNAGFGVRLFAYLTDMAVLLIPTAVIRGAGAVAGLVSPGGFWARAVFFRYTPAAIAAWLVSALYFVLMTYWYGGTLGKMLLRIKVISVERRKPTLWEIVVREVFGRYLSAVVLMLGYLIVIGDGQKRAFHDHIADTQVIYVHGAGAYRPRGRKARPVPVPTVPEMIAPITEPETPVLDVETPVAEPETSVTETETPVTESETSMIETKNDESTDFSRPESKMTES